MWACTGLTSEEFEGLYGREYFEGGEYPNYGREASALRRNFQERVNELFHRHPDGGSLFEIGCAYGFFLCEAARHFAVSGCDLSAHAVLEARERIGYDVEQCDFLARPPGNPYDIICLWDTIEHLNRPDRYLEKAAAELKVGGTLAMGTADSGSFLARWRGEKWRMIHPPTHVHYFSASSIRTLLHRLGFSRIQISHVPFWRHADGIAKRVVATSGNMGMKYAYNILHKYKLLEFDVPLQTYDLMVVYGTLDERNDHEA